MIFYLLTHDKCSSPRYRYRPLNNTSEPVRAKFYRTYAFWLGSKNRAVLSEQTQLSAKAIFFWRTQLTKSLRSSTSTHIHRAATPYHY